jgi:hypothetical protein
MAKGHTVCQYCGQNVPSAHIKRHISLYHPDILKPLSLKARLLKIIVLSLVTLTLAYYSFKSETIIIGLFLAFLWGGILADLVINLKKLKRKMNQTPTIQTIGEKTK